MSKYPTWIACNDDTIATIERGHGLCDEQVEAAYAIAIGDRRAGTVLAVEEEHLRWVRLKWCEGYSWPCDDGGEWHSHWVETEPKNDGSTAFSIIRERPATTRT